MSKETLKFIVIIPFFNEGNRISLPVFSEGFGRWKDVDFVLVDDGSSDNTLKLLNELSQHHENVEVLAMDSNVGKAEAVRRAVIKTLEKECDYIGYMDADLATPFSEMKKLMNYAIEHSEKDIIMGARIKLAGNKVERSLWRHYLGRIFATIVSQFILKEPIYDTQCGAKIIKKDLTSFLFEIPFKTKWLFDVELLLRYKEKYGRIEKGVVEIPLYEWTEVKGTKIKWYEFFNVPLQLLKLKYAYDK